MKEKLLRSFDESEKVRHQLLARLDALPVDRLSQRPSPEAWSVVEVGGHGKASVFAAARNRSSTS